MPRSRGRNGGSIGKLRTTDESNQSGIWGLYDAHQLRSDDIWGVTPAEPKFNWRYYAYGSGIGTITVKWVLSNGTEYALRSVTGQQHTGSTQTWNTYSEDLSSYSGTTGRIYFMYRTGNSFYNDPQLDNMELVDTTAGTISLDPGTSTGRGRWQRHGSYTTSYSSPWTTTFYSIPISSSTTYLWNYDAGGTPSSATGGTRDADGSSSGYYLYFEGSSPNNSSSTRYYWIRMSQDYTLL